MDGALFCPTIKVRLTVSSAAHSAEYMPLLDTAKQQSNVSCLQKPYNSLPALK